MKAPKGLLTGAIGSLVAAVFMVGMNLFQLGDASGWDWKLIERYFLTADAIEFTGRRSGVAEMLRYVWVWGPVLMVPLGIVLLILHFAMKGRKGAQLFADFQQRGWIGRQRSLAVSVQNGKTQTPIALVGPAAAPEGYVDQPAMQFAEWTKTLDKKGIREVSNAALKAGALIAAAAPTVHPNLPADMIVTKEQKGGELVVVIPPANGASKGHKVLMIKGQNA